MVKKALHFINASFLVFFIFLIGLVPFWKLYLLSDILAWLLRKVVRYRRKVIAENLIQAGFAKEGRPDEQLIKSIYRNLSDIILEGVKSFTMSKRSVIKRHRVVNPELLTPFYERNQSLILATGHIGNWEWGSLSAGLQTPYQILGFYKRLKNPYADSFIRWSRSRFGTTLASIKETTLSFERQRGKPTLFLMAADQNPRTVKNAWWIDFLGRKTAFLHGPEKHARINEYPLVYADIVRVKRGFYEIALRLLVETPENYTPGEITAMYARELQKSIEKNPANWLWSHRRWKHQPPSEN